MKKLILFLCLGISLNASAQLPYNPDSDGDELITLSDMLEFLPLFGQQYFLPDVLGIEAGGTGANNVLDAKFNLDLSMFSDSSLTIANNPIATGWVSGGLRVTQRFAQGDQANASGLFAMASGSVVNASGDFSNATNRNTTASGICSHAEGEGCVANSTAAHAEGFQSDAINVAAHAEGWGTEASGAYSHAQNRNTRATATCSHAEGEACVASSDAAHAEGMNTVASAIAAHAEGFGTDATGNYSHAEGRLTLASGQSSHAEGESCTASATASHAGGNMSSALASYSFAHGTGITADHNDHFAIGKYNQLGQINVVFAVGNGTGDATRSDAFQVNIDGTAALESSLTVGGTVVASGTDLLQEILNLQAANAAMAQQIADMQAAIELLQQGLNGQMND